jgi:hypothetical protein
MVLQNFDPMLAENIQITLLKLTDGSRLLRLTEPETGLALERTINPQRPLLAQKQQLKALFESMIQRADVLLAA